MKRPGSLRGRMAGWIAALTLGGALLGLGALDRLRREDVLYVDDYLKEAVYLKTLRSTSLTFSRDGNGFLDTLRAGQQVRLIGIAEDRFLVEARLINQRAEGWVLPRDMEAIPEAVIKEIQKKSAEAEKEKKAIARGEIEVGMSQEAVLKVLGKPKTMSSITDEVDGKYDQWKYPTYKTVPVYVPTLVNGTNAVYTFYQKVLVGEKVVTFRDKKVVRFETRQDTNAPVNQTVVPPVYVQ